MHARYGLAAQFALNGETREIPCVISAPMTGQPVEVVMILISERATGRGRRPRRARPLTEGDLIVGANSGSAIGTLVERMTGFVMLLHLHDNYGADAVQDAMAIPMSQLPAVLKKTLTRDQGTELAMHREITLATKTDIYFCDPHSPWQRGSNENTKRVVAPVLPDLSVYTTSSTSR